MLPAAFIAHKRDGGEHSDGSLNDWINAYTRGEVAEEQMAAWAMAVCCRGMSAAETAALTWAVACSGRRIDLGAIAATKVDKHSTGGVGDKVSIALAPLVAACGVPVPMMCGRGLGHTGGTVDKLEAISGFCTQLSSERFAAQVGAIGCAMAAQSPELVPADRKLYALRDVTGTVESVPLITASILAKKIAEGTDALVLDIKVGRGAFMQTLSQAQALRGSLEATATALSLRTYTYLTQMDAPLGYAIGNALETHEAIALLHDPKGNGTPADVRELTLELAARMLLVGQERGRQVDSDSTTAGLDAARQRVEGALRSGQALDKLRSVIAAQGGDPRVVDEPSRLPQAPCEHHVSAEREGFVASIDPLVLGRLAVAMGAGRARRDSAIDPAVGIRMHVRVGDKVGPGDRLATLHMGAAADKTRFTAVVHRALTWSEKPTAALPLWLRPAHRLS